MSFAVLTGPPIAGVLIQRAEGHYLYAQLFASTSLLIGFTLISSSRLASTGWHWHVKM